MCQGRSQGNLTARENSQTWTEEGTTGGPVYRPISAASTIFLDETPKMELYCEMAWYPKEKEIKSIKLNHGHGDLSLW